MNAPLPSTADRILQHLRGHHARKPARADDILAMAGGPEAEFWAALEQLVAQCQINTAHIQRRGEPAAWLAIWPTGIIHHPGRLTNARLSDLFTPTRSARDILRDVSGPKARTAPAGTEPKAARAARRGRPAIDWTDRIRAILAGRARDDALTVRQICIALGSRSVSPHKSYGPQVRAAAASTQWMRGIKLPSTGGAPALAWYDARAHEPRP